MPYTLVIHKENSPSGKPYKGEDRGVVVACLASIRSIIKFMLSDTQNVAQRFRRN